jgi:uncharacterized protein YlzI (FlbEa/FlbD family)
MFLKMTRLDGVSIVVNTDYILEVEPYTEEHTYITYEGGRNQIVNEPFRTVRSALLAYAMVPPCDPNH